jgi:hypothetical protein
VSRPPISFSACHRTHYPAQFTERPILELVPTMENEIQSQLSAVGLLLAAIVQDVYEFSPVVFSIVKKHSLCLESWQSNLVETMRLAELRKERGPIHTEPHRRSLILVHILYFGAQMLLKRRLLVTAAQERINRRWTLDGSYEEALTIQRQCVAAAEECVNLLDILGYTRQMLRRCWMCM